MRMAVVSCMRTGDGNKDGENEEIKDFLGSGCADIWILL